MEDNEKFKLTEKGKAFAVYCGMRMWETEVPKTFVNDEYEEILTDFDFEELSPSEKKQLVAFRHFLFFSEFLGDKRQEVITRLMVMKFAEDNDNSSSLLS